jgi:hypothetical protein
MAIQGETYTVRWKKTGDGREVEVTVNNKKLKVTDEREVRVEIDGQLRGKFSVKQKKQNFPDFDLLEQTEIAGTTFSATQLLPKNCLIFTHNSPVCVDIPTRHGIIHR